MVRWPRRGQAAFAFFTRVAVGGRRLTAVGVLMGQGHGGDTSELLAAAGKAAKQLVGFVAPTTRVRTIAALRAAGGRRRDAASHDGGPLLRGTDRRSAQN